jgi:hypothetical protein
LEPFERTCIEAIGGLLLNHIVIDVVAGRLKPWDVGVDNPREPSLLHKEITPNGCKELVRQFPEASVLCDLGSGMWQAAVVTSVLSSMTCYGIEIQSKLHSLGAAWCSR